MGNGDPSQGVMYMEEGISMFREGKTTDWLPVLRKLIKLDIAGEIASGCTVTKTPNNA
jgi:hypothetical protein